MPIPRLLIFASALVTLAACDSGGSPSGPPVVTSATELGPIEAPASVTARDAGISARVGNQVFWLFADTIFNPASVDGTNGRSSTAAYAPLNAPRQTSEPTDANGAPAQAVPFTSQEAAYNAANAPTRIALWPGGILPTADGALSFNHKLIVRSGLFNYEHQGVEMATFQAGQTVGTRMGTLFTPEEPLFLAPLVRDGFVYLYGMIVIDGSQGVGVARAPLADVRDRSAYRTWDGADWVPTLSDAATLFKNVPGAVSVLWNEHLGRYIAVHSFALSNRVVMRTAAAPEGPWSEPLTLFTGMTPTDGVNYAGEQHPELAEDGGQTIFVSYYQPLGFLRGQLHLVRVRFE